jgi:hypothetical protein
MATPTARVKIPKPAFPKTLVQRGIERVVAFVKALMHIGAITFWALMLKVCADQIVGRSVGLFRWWIVGVFSVLFVLDEWKELRRKT